jgi:TonB family protein
MLRTHRSWLVLVALVCALAPAQRGAAQAPATPAEPASVPAPAPEDPSAVTQPKLLAFVDAGYPDEARAQKLEAEVLLVLTIGEDGFVESAELAGPPVGYGFDELALGAARRFVFEPATKGGQPLRSRIRYRYEFKFQEPPAPASAAPEEVPAGRLELVLLSAEDGTPLSNGEVIVSASFDPSRVSRLVTDEQGKAGLEALPPGTYELSINRDKYASEVHQEEVTPGEVTALVYRLGREIEDQGYGAVARVKAPPREVTRRTIEREVLTRVAGTRGDALRTIELLPGVSRPPFGAGLVLIRGAAPQDSQVFLDGVPVPLLYHFGGLTSFINSRALDRIDFFPGNFSARYGRLLGGIVDVGVRDPASDGYHGVLDVNLPLDSSLLLEGPITKNASFLVAGRRSYFGEILTATVPSDAFDQFAAPVYYDYQAFVSYRPTHKDKLRFGSYGSSDRLEVLFAEAPDDDPSIRGVELGLKFQRQQIGWDHRYSPKLDQTIEVSYGHIVQGFAAGREIVFDLDIDNVYLRGEWRYTVSPWVQLTAGTDSAFNRYEVRYIGPDFSGSDSTASVSQRPQVRVKEEGAQLLPAVYAEVALRPIEDLRMIPSVRLDYFDEIGHFAFDPRFVAIYSLTKKTRLKGGVGVFSQAPNPPEATKTLGNPNLKPTKAIHYSVGVDHDFTDEFSLGVEGFYKSITDRVVAPDPRLQGETGVEPPRFVNGGIGRIYGLEVAGRKQASGRWFGFLSYTLMRSERRDFNGPWYLFDFDQTHIFSAAAALRLGRGWELGATLRFVSGNPDTPIIGASNNLTSGTFNGDLGKQNSTRAPAFHRLDLRAEKQWTFDSWRLALYLDIQNTYNAKNIESVSYSFDFTETAEVRGLPIIPILGLRGEL